MSDKNKKNLAKKKMKKFLSLIMTFFCALNLNAQKKLADCQRIIISDSISVKIYKADKNSYETSDKNISVKFKKGVLNIFRIQKMQMDVHGDTKVKGESSRPKINLYLNSKVENITITDYVSADFINGFNTKKIILKVEKNSEFSGEISAQAFGLFLKSGSESYLKGNFRTTKLSADSAKIEFSSFEADNSEIIVEGGSIVSIEGKTEKLNLIVSGLSRFEGLRLNAKNSIAKISGNSDVFFNTKETLNITASERSHIVLTGNPKIEQNVSKDCKFSKR